MNPYGIEALWQQGDVVARGTLAVLALMSIGSWYVAISKFIEQWRLMRDARDAAGAFRYIAETGATARKEYAAMAQPQVDLNSWLTLALDGASERVASRLQSGLALLATVGSTAPFVGLFGTVWGIYHALTAIGIAGQASIDKVAGPVGEALIMTALGLAVAVPAVLAYNWLVRRNRVALEEIRRFARREHMKLLA